MRRAPRRDGGKPASAPPPDAPWLAPLLLAALAVCLASLCLTKITDYDVWWHLRTGQWILEHKAVPRVDVFSYTIAGHPWVPFEWLSQVIFYGMDAIAGLAGLTLFKTGIVILTFLCMALYGQTRKAAAAPALTAVLALAAWGGRISYIERPQIFTFLLTALYLLILKQAERRPARLWILLPLQALWSNLHGGAGIIGLVLIGGWWMGELVRKNSRRLGLILALCAAASCLNPSGWTIYAHLLGTIGFSARSAINEWAPLPFTRAFATVWVPLLALEIVSAAAWLANPQRRVGEGLLWLGFLLLSFQALRFADQALFFFAQIAVGNLAPLLESRRPRPRALAAAAAFALAFLAAGTWACETYGFPGMFPPGLGAAHDAKDAVGFIEKAGLKGNLFNSYELGGQVLWYAPGRPVFVDGRSLEYGADFVRDAINWFRPDVWKRLDERYRFQIALVQNGPYYLCSILDGDPSWALAYWDDEALVYVRKGGENAAAAKAGYRYLKPNQTDFYYLQPAMSDAPTAAAVLAEAQRSIDSAPGHVNPRLLKANLLRLLGRPREALEQSETAIRLAPDLAEPYYEDALTLQELGRTDEAQARYRECLRAAGRSERVGLEAQALNNLAAIAYRRGDRAEASALWRRALEKDPQNASARHNLAVTGQPFP